MTKVKNKLIKIKILLPMAGRFLLSDRVGDVVSYPESLATELVESKYAEEVIVKTIKKTEKIKK